MLIINENFIVPDSNLKFDFVRSAGPGGQNVNKVATAAQLRFDINMEVYLSEEQKQRLRRLAGKKLNSNDVIIIVARRYRSQEKNRQDALERLSKLIQKALIEPKVRLKKKPSKAVKEQRLLEKKKLSQKKHARQKKRDFSDD